MNRFTNLNINKEFKKKTKILLIGILLLIICALSIAYREKKVKDADKVRINIHEITNSGAKASNVPVFLDATYIASAIASYQNDDNNSFYVIFDQNAQYVVYMKNSEAERISKYLLDNPDESYRMFGTTEIVPDGMDEYGRAFIKEWLDTNHDHSEGVEDSHTHEITQEEYYEYFGYVYLDNTINRYEDFYLLTIIIWISLMFGIIIFIFGLIKVLSFKRRVSKLSDMEISNLDSEMNNVNSVYYDKGSVYITPKYLIDFNKFAYYDYRDISWVYMHKEYYNGILNSQSLIINTKDGKRHEIARTLPRKKNNVIYDNIFDTIIKAHPEVKIGYTHDNIKVNQEKLKEIKKEKKRERKS